MTLLTYMNQFHPHTLIHVDRYGPNNHRYLYCSSCQSNRLDIHIYKNMIGLHDSE